MLTGDNVPICSIGENCSGLACDVIRHVLKVNMNPSAVVTAHRIGRKPVGQAPDKRSILMKLANQEEKKNILQSCRRVKPTGFFVNESLSPNKAAILYCLRRAKRKFPSKIDGCGSQDGRVYVWTKPHILGGSNVKTFISTRDRLNQWCETTLNVLPDAICDMNNQQ